MKPFTVISTDPQSGHIFSDHVMANSIAHSFSVAAQQRSEHSTELDFVTSIEGHLSEGSDIGFPGEGVVDVETILDQDDVFS